MPIAATACRRRARTPDGPPGTLRAVKITAESRVDFSGGGPARRRSRRGERPRSEAPPRWSVELAFDARRPVARPLGWQTRVLRGALPAGFVCPAGGLARRAPARAESGE